MVTKIARLFTIRTRFEAFAIIYALALGAVGRGLDYLTQYPGPLGYLFFVACITAVFMAGAKIIDATKPWNRQERRAAGNEDTALASSAAPAPGCRHS